MTYTVRVKRLLGRMGCATVAQLAAALPSEGETLTLRERERVVKRALRELGVHPRVMAGHAAARHQQRKLRAFELWRLTPWRT